MTLDEAIAHAEERGSICCSECAREHMQLAQWLKELKELRKYAWHDLRKNPNDLPKVNNFVLCEWVGGTHNWHDVFLFDNDPRPHFRNTHGNMISIVGDEKFTCEGQVIAWREIEQFEGLTE